MDTGRDGQQCGRPSFDIGEDQLAFLLEFGFKVNNISNFLGVSKRTVERMSTFWLSVSGNYCKLLQPCELSINAILFDSPSENENLWVGKK